MTERTFCPMVHGAWARALSRCTGALLRAPDTLPHVPFTGALAVRCERRLFSCQTDWFSRCFGTLESDAIQGQKAQIVQSCMTLDDFLP